ncbi:hypothetical protein [Mesorhizobium captivum]|uniref:hypothetical protein n=1 Tax=Mesorhizobium captivum TaxID=3072319 RepID=UPI002A24BCDB|nr:hypothetical protein [Mesorhizobium sp. VK3C]MDX8449163.1 hypothetical protein [Mesorhizobium sp. VK3C]
MTGGNLLSMALLKRKAVVFVRQSTPNRFMHQRRQYELVDVTRRWGFHNVEVIDEGPQRDRRHRNGQGSRLIATG